MSLKRIILIISTMFVILALFNISNAYTITCNDIKAKKGEEFTVILKVDKETPLANGHIKYDSSKIEFVKTNQEYMKANVKADGDLAWIYLQVTPEGIKSGTNQFEFVFKAKSKETTKLNLEDLAFVDVDGNEYTIQNMEKPKTEININKNNGTTMLIIISIVILVILILIFRNKRK